MHTIRVAEVAPHEAVQFPEVADAGA